MNNTVTFFKTTGYITARMVFSPDFIKSYKKLTRAF